MKKSLAFTLSVSLFVQTMLIPWTVSAAPDAPGAPGGPGAPMPPPIVVTPTYEIEGGFTGRIIQTNQEARAAQNASITLLIGGISDNFPALNTFSTDCINQQGPGPADAYAIFLDNSSINMSQCEAFGGTEIIRNAGPMIIDPFTATTTKATPTQVASAMASRGYLNHVGTNNPAFTITRTNGRYVTFTRTDNTEGNVNYVDSNGVSSSRFFYWRSDPAQTALSSQVQISEYVPSNPRYNERFNMVIDYNTYEYIVQEDDTISDVVAGLVTAYNNDIVPGISCTDNMTRVLCTASSDTIEFATSASVIYEIPDEIAPQITLNGQNYVGTQTGSEYVEAGSAFSDSAIWIDNRAGSGIPTITGDIVDTTMTGSYVRTYTVTDPDSNMTEVTMTYIVRDTTAPDIILNGNDSVTYELDYGEYYDDGANWTDNLDEGGYLNGIITDDERTAAGTGRYYLSYDVTDASGNNAGASRTVEIVDTRAPNFGQMSFPGNSVDSDYYYVDWYIPGANSVTISGGLLTGTTNIKMVSPDLYRIFVPLIQDSANFFVLVATDVSGNQSTTNFLINEASAGEKNYFRLTAFGGTHVTDVSEVVGTQTGATKIVPKVNLTIVEEGESNTSILIPQDTEITRKGGGIFDPTKIKTEIATVTGGLTGTDRSRGAIEFGKSGTPLLFSKPVRVEFSLSGTSYTGRTIEVKVKHAGESTFTTSGLTNNSGATCSNGLASTGTNIGTIVENVVTIYTCAASTFAAVTPDGPQNTVVSSSSSNAGGGSIGGSSPSIVTQTLPKATQTGVTQIPMMNSGVLWTQVVQKRASKKLERYTLTLTEENKKKPNLVILPVGFKNGTKVIIRLVSKNGKKYSVTVTVKEGKISFRPRVSGIYEVIRK